MNLTEINKSEVVIFKPKDGLAEFQVIFDAEHDTVWVTEQQLMELYGKARRTIEYQIKNVYEERELDKIATWRKFRRVQTEGKREVSRKINDYALALTVAQSHPKQRETIQN